MLTNSFEHVLAINSKMAFCPANCATCILPIFSYDFLKSIMFMKGKRRNMNMSITNKRTADVLKTSPLRIANSSRQRARVRPSSKKIAFMWMHCGGSFYGERTIIAEYE